MYWACVRVAFGLSAVLFAYSQCQRAEDLERQLAIEQDRSKPKLSCDFFQWIFSFDQQDKNKT